MSYGEHRHRKFFKPVIRPAAKSPVVLSFINLIEAHVLAAIRRKHRVDMPAVRRSVSFLKDKLGSLVFTNGSKGYRLLIHIGRRARPTWELHQS
jgi:hypothetical protein